MSTVCQLSRTTASLKRSSMKAVMLPAALNVLEWFHLAKKPGDVVDEVRRQETKQLAAEGYEHVLKNSILYT